MKENKTFRQNERRQCPTFLLKLFTLLVMLVSGVNAWGQTELYSFTMPSEMTTTEADAKVNYGTNARTCWRGIYYTLNDDSSVKELGTNYYDGTEKTHYRLKESNDSFDENKAHFKIDFPSDYIKAGDVLTVELSPYWYFTEGTKTIGFKTKGGSESLTVDAFKSGYSLSHTITSADITNSTEDGRQYIMITMPGEATCYHKFTVTRPAGYTVTFGPTVSGRGTVTATANGAAITSGQTVPSGTEVTFTAAANSGFRTWRWEGDCAGERYGPLTTTVTVTKNITVNYNFTQGITLNAYAKDGNYGNVIIENGGNQGNTLTVNPWPGDATFKATPKAGCTLVGWYTDVNCTQSVQAEADKIVIDGNNVIYKSDYLSTDGTTINLWAKFAPITHAVNFGVVKSDNTAQTDGYGSVTATVDGNAISSGAQVQEGKEVVFTANPAEGKIEWGWYNNDSRNYEANPYTVTVGAADLTVNAVIHDGIYFNANVASSCSAYGSVRIECSGNRGTSFHTNPGTPNIKLIATPKTGVTFVGWYSNAECSGDAVSTATEYTLTNTNSGQTLYAKFEMPAGTYAVNWSTNMVLPSGCDAWFTLGDDATEYRESVFGIANDTKVNMHAKCENTEYSFADFKVNNTPYWNNLTYSENVNGQDMTVVAEFCSAFTYTATSNVSATLQVYTGDNTSENVNGQKLKSWNPVSKVTFKVTEDSGLAFDGWYNGDTRVSTDQTYIINNGDSEKTMSRSYEARFTIPDPIGGQRVKASLADLGKGSVPTWTGGHLATEATSYNHVDVFRFPLAGSENINVSDASDNYTGIRFNANASTSFRILVYVDGETNARITTLNAGNKEYVYTWADLGVPAESVDKVTRVCFAGQKYGSTDVTFKDVWVEKIDDPCHTFVMYGETGGSYDNGTYTYTLATPEGNATAVFNSIDGGSRRGYTKEMKLENELTITAPAGKTIKAVKVITDAQASELVFTGLGNEANAAYSTAVTDGYEVVWTHDNVQSVTITNADASAKKANIAKVEVIYNNGDIKHPALNKNAVGQYAADLAKITTTGGFAYDAETNTVYSSSTADYGGDIRIDFETPQDFTYLSKIIIGSDDTSIFNFCNLVPTTAADYHDYIGVRLGADGFTDEQKTDINGKLIKTIIIGSSALTTGKMKLNYIGFDISHMDPKVALDCSNEIRVAVGQKFTLKGHASAGENGPGAAFWRIYDDNKQNPTDFPGINDGNRWSPEITLTATEKGTFYYGIRAHHNCPEGHPNYNSQYDGYQTSEPMFVTVIVEENNIYKQLLLDFDDNTYTEPGESKGRQYRIYVPQSVCNGTDADKANVPVVFSLHGTGNDNDPAAGGVQNFNELAEANKFIVVYPRGRKADNAGDQLNGLWGRGWEATGADNEDTKFFRAIIVDLKGDRSEFKLNGTKQFTIDESRIYFTGFSNGGMMAYAVANTDADKFAAFASISGLPMNEMHMRHHNARPVPFMHIHGTKDSFVKYSHMPTIVDNMLFRNGLAMNPNATEEGAANGTATRYKMSSYTDGAAPYIYYEIGTGPNTSDTGMGHEHQCTIGDKSSMQVIWEFFSGKTLPNPVSNPFEFKARINTANNNARNHGWQTNTSSGILAQYGESGGYTSTGENVYHTIQLKGGTHSIQFTAKGTSTNYVMVKVTKLADFTTFNTMGKTAAPVTETVVINNAAYYVRDGQISIPFNGDAGEYMITITKGGQYDNTTIEDIAIVSGSESVGTVYDKPVNTDFGGYFNYNNRLFAQWNFDLSDGYRTNARKLEVNADEHNENRGWTANLSNTDFNGTTLNNGTIVFVNHKPIGTNIEDSNYDTNLTTYHELTYNCSYTEEGPNDIIAIAAGLKFKAPKESLKLYVDIANGQVSGAHLVVDEHVKMYVPYVENSYRNDKNESEKPEDHQSDFENCVHHINRDILYIALNQGTIWDVWENNRLVSQGHVKNECIDLPGQSLFGNGGDEFVNGKNYNKGDYMGKYGTPCIVQFNRETNIDRIGVNRNLIYSFYTEYINELGKTKPSTRFRVEGSPTGLKVANVGGTWTKYEGAIAMTYGGWMNSEGGSSYTKYNDVATTDAWTDLGVVNYEPDNSAIHFNTWASMKPSQAGTNSLPAIDGFPVVALLDTEARSGSLLPSSLAPTVAKTENGVDYVDKTVTDEETGEDKTVYIPNYTPACAGEYMVPTSKPYEPNITPWSLPSRGGYAKFEPSIPGVLNMNVVQQGGHDYYIADEFGNLVDQSTIFSVTGMKQTIDKSNGCYRIANTDYVKHSLNVEPGKTYYIFSNTTGLGIAGFYFEPYVNHDGTERGRINIGVKSIKLKAGEAYSLPSEVNATETITSPTADGTKDYTINYSKKAVEVDLRRAFKANQWETICLPYSMNQVQMEQAFGKGTRVVLLRDIQDKEHSVDNKVTMTLICHENQDIIAGYPYLIRPTEAAPNGVKTIASLPETANVPSIVTVKSEGLNTNSYPVNSGGEKTYKYYGGINQYTFKGQYGGSATVRNGSYVVKDGKLCKVNPGNTTPTTISGYRAWVELNESVTEPKLAKTITRFVGADGEVDEEEATEIDIDQMLEQQGIFSNKATIYNVNGQVVRQNAANLNDLPKGIYIVNGKKYIVK